jgi:hypothetical protein
MARVEVVKPRIPVVLLPGELLADAILLVLGGARNK